MVALVPVRDPGAGKTRLSAHLTPRQRAALAAAMLADVTAAIRAAPVARVVVAASGPTGAATASALGLDVVLDPPSATTLDDVVGAALQRLGTVSTLLVVAADLPRLRPEEVAEMVDIDAQVVVASTGDGGTGGLLRSPAGVIRTAYGPGSAAAHMRLSHEAGVHARAVSLPGFRHDVDTWEDLRALDPRAAGNATARFLQQLRQRAQPAGS